MTIIRDFIEVIDKILWIRYFFMVLDPGNTFFCLLHFQVVKQCCGTDGVEANYIKTEILPPFFKHFWQHRMALDRRNYRQVGSNKELNFKKFFSNALWLFFISCFATFPFP